MGRRSDRMVAGRLADLFRAGTVSGLSDGQLLERFAAGRGDGAEQAFSALVERHGSMVLRACRNVLGRGLDPQDSFQATFLILARRGGSLWVRDSLAPWLHRVACRVAIRARRVEGRRRLAERGAVDRAIRSAGGPSRDDAADWLHEEIDRLPERYRALVILCDLEGDSYEVAAKHLGCPVGTVKSRLSRARERLRDRLTRRGLSGPIAGLLPPTVDAIPRGPVPTGLVDSATRGALALGSGKAGAASAPATVQVLVEEVSRAMILQKTRWVAAALLAGGVASTGTALLARQEPSKPPEAGAVAQVPAKEDEAKLRERDEALKRRSRFNLRVVSLALARYSGAGFLPPAVLRPKGGGPPYSWRVAILPFMDQQALYDEYKFDEAWDGPNNRKLLARIPDAFRAPGDEKASTNASYFALVGPGAIFDGSGGTDPTRIPDGASQTIQVVEAKRAVPWTKPEDIPFTADDPLPALGGYYGAASTLGGFHAGFADGSVRLISGDIGDDALRALISKAGGEVVKLP